MCTKRFKGDGLVTETRVARGVVRERYQASGELVLKALDLDSVGLGSCVCSGFRRCCDEGRCMRRNDSDVTGNGPLQRSNGTKKGMDKEICWMPIGAGY